MMYLHLLVLIGVMGLRKTQLAGLPNHGRYVNQQINKITRGIQVTGSNLDGFSYASILDL